MRRKKLIALAAALEEDQGAVRADFQQYYGLNLDEMGERFSTLHAADLLVELPDDSRTMMRGSDGGAWTFDRTLAAMQLNALNTIAWLQSADGQKGRNRPRPVGPFAKKPRRIEAMAMTVEELDEILSRPRGGTIG